MTPADFQPRTCPLHCCSAAAVRRTPAKAAELAPPRRNEGAQQTEFSVPVGLRHSDGRCMNDVPKEGVCNVHALGFGDFFRGVADLQGEEPGSSPTSGTCLLLREPLLDARLRLTRGN
jgi:hypothetical protein